MKATKLTTAQIEKLSIALANQFMGKTILVGARFSYNWNEIFVGTPKFISENKYQAYVNECKIGNKQWGKALLNVNVFESMALGYNQFYRPIVLNVAKLMQFANGQEVINQALYMVALQNANN